MNSKYTLQFSSKYDKYKNGVIAYKPANKQVNNDKKNSFIDKQTFLQLLDNDNNDKNRKNRNHILIQPNYSNYSNTQNKSPFVALNNTRKNYQKFHQSNINEPWIMKNSESRSKSRKKDLNIISKIMFGQGTISKEQHKNKIDDILNDISNINKNWSNLSKIESNRKKFGNSNISNNWIFSDIKKKKNNILWDENNGIGVQSWKKVLNAQKKVSTLSSPNSKENIFNTSNHNSEQVNTETNENQNRNNMNIMNGFSNSSENLLFNASRPGKGTWDKIGSNTNNKLVIDTVKANRECNSQNVKFMKSDANWTDKAFPHIFNRTTTQAQIQQKESFRPYSSIMANNSNSNNINAGLKSRVYTNKEVKMQNNMKTKHDANLNPKQNPRSYSHMHKSKTKILEYNENSISLNNQDDNDSCLEWTSNRIVDSEPNEGTQSQNKIKPTVVNKPLGLKSINYNSSQPNTTPYDQKQVIVKNKEDYFSKLVNMDESKFKKIMQIVDEWENDDIKDEPQVRAIKNSNTMIPQTTNINSINSINYYKTSSINFGDININYSNPANDANPKLQTVPSLIPVSIYILSTYSWYNSVFGWTEIQLYDINNNYIPIIKYKTNSLNNSPNLQQLFNGVYKTVNEAEMFVGKWIPNCKIDMYIDNRVDIGKIIIWNYNGKELNNGVQSIEIYKKNILIWNGIVRKGNNNVIVDYSTVIKWGYYSKKDFDNSSYTKTKNSTRHFSASKTYMNSARNKSPFNTWLSGEHEGTIGINKYESNQHEINCIEEDSLNTSNSEDKNSYEKSNWRTSIGQTSYNMLLNHNPSNTNNNNSNNTNINNQINNISNTSFTNYYNGSIITCNKIKIVLASNYGHRKFIGLSGIIFLDENKEPIDIESASSIGALPKDINSYYGDNEDLRIFENVFNQNRNTADPSQMWLTVSKPNEPLPYLELYFDEQINISAIKIYNYNSPDELDKCTKSIEWFFDDHLEYSTFHETIILHKGIGEGDIDYSQEITFPIKPLQYKDYELTPFNNWKYASFLFTQCYWTPFLPSGFYIKISFISNYGDYDIVSLDNIEIYDQCGRDVLIKNKGEFKIVNKQAYVTNKKDIEEALTMKYNNIKLEGNTDETENNLYFFFKNPIAISYIQISNCTRNPNEGAKDIQISLEDNIIFAGELNKARKTIILFTCDMAITKGWDENLWSKPKSNTGNTKAIEEIANGIFSLNLVGEG